MHRLQHVFALQEADIKLYNLGVSGDTTEDVLAHLEVEARARTPEAIIFAIGINDSRYKGSRSQPCISLEQFVTNLAAILDLARALTPRVGFVGLTNVDATKTKPIPLKPEWHYDSEAAAEYNGALRKFCEQNHVPFCDVFNLAVREDLPDGLHPDAHGHELLAQVLEPWLVRILA